MNEDNRKNVKLQPEIWEMLRMIKNRDEAFSDVIDNLLREKVLHD